jgi:signal transduction histidine kinase
LQRSTTFRRFLYRNSYLLVIAAWLITFSFIVDNYWSGNSSIGAVKRNLQKYIHAQERDFEKLAADTALLHSLDANTYDEAVLNTLTAKPYFFYRYFINDVGHRQLVFWSSATAMPDDALLQNLDSTGFTKLLNGYYVWRKLVQGNHISIALIPVKWDYIVTNEYLENAFVIGDDIAASYDIAKTPTGTSVRSLNGKELFPLLKKSDTAIVKNNLVAVWLRIIAAVFILLFVHLCATYIAIHRQVWKGVLFLLLVILLLRFITYAFPVLFNFRQFELFNPAIYGSNFILRSLGDLLINSFLFTWLGLFIRHQVMEKGITLDVKHPAMKWGALVISTMVLLLAGMICGQIVRSLVADSQISFDVIDFFKLTRYSVIGFVVLCCIAIGYFVTAQVLLFLVKPLFPGRTWLLFLVVALCGLAWLSLQGDFSNVRFSLFVLLWQLLFLLLMTNESLALPAGKISSSKLIFWLFFFSLSITIVIVEENKSKELRNRRHYAETLSTKVDPSSETLMNTLLTDFRNDYLATNFDRFKTDSSNRLFKDSLVNGNFSGYTNKYDTKVYTYDADEQPLYNSAAVTYNELNTLLNTQAKPTSITDLYYYDESYDRFSYISRKVVTNPEGQLLGYVFLLANPKKYKTDALNLELFSRGHNNSIENSSEYAFAIYNNLQLVSSHNDYPFATSISKQQMPKEEFEAHRKNNYDELWYKAGPQKLVIIARQDNFLIESITLFSYLFCAFLLVTALFWILNIFIRSRLNRQPLRNYWQLTIRNQIHGTVIFVSVLSFLVIGVATILFFIYRYENNNREKLSRVINVMGNEVRTSLTELAMFDDVVKVYDEAYRARLEKVIIRISEIHDADVNLYDGEGNLRVSSLPLPYNKGIVSDRMDPVAYYHLNRQREVQYFKDEKIGKLSFVSNYVPVIDEAGREYAYLNIPYFTSQGKLRQEISNFLVTIINLNAFIFLIAGIVALFITNRITRSFSFISNKMKAVNLGKRNEVIDWKRDDEIGELIKEYNKMVGKLDESAAALAKSEREGAWREMARQVAHEIKNPLTPMKLSLQYLQKSISSNSANVQELTAHVAQTLVEQIDHLNRIAGEFGQFANIGNPKNELFDLHDSIKALVLLHGADEQLQLEWKPIGMPAMVNADRTHINRLFTNLIQNAIQAVPGDLKPHIAIEEEIQGKKLLVRIKDNGVGISEEQRSRIFTPNFTTKTSGTGLGLAMSKGIVEQAKGQIWFETKPGEGSTFFVELPLA